jgi:transketolase
MPIGMAPSAYVLWKYFLNVNPEVPNWINRDRFVLSAGHGSVNKNI